MIGRRQFFGILGAAIAASPSCRPSPGESMNYDVYFTIKVTAENVDSPEQARTAAIGFLIGDLIARHTTIEQRASPAVQAMQRNAEVKLLSWFDRAERR